MTRDTAPAPTAERINRYLASVGVASRRGADSLVAAGRVRVGGRRAEIGCLVRPDLDTVTVDGVPVPAARERRTLMVNKPRGVVSTRRDPQARPTVLNLVEDPAGLFPVGRLDIGSRGLIVLTSDGDLALRMTHPRYGMTKTYRVTVRERATDRLLRTLRSGVMLEDGPAAAASAALVGTTASGDVVEVVMTEGRKREVRRLVTAVGATVLDLQRTAIGPLLLGRLREGHARRLRPAEEHALYTAAEMAPPHPLGRRW